MRSAAASRSKQKQQHTVSSFERLVELAGGNPTHLIVSYGRGAPSLSADCEAAFVCVPHPGIDSKLNSVVAALEPGQLGIDAI